MNTRSYALRLAQELDAFPTAPHHKQAAAELRRLLAVETQRDALLEALKAAVVGAELRREGAVDVDVIRAAIKMAEGENHAKSL